MSRERLGALAVPLAVLALALTAAKPALCAPGDALERGFRSPPASARPHTWWHWCNGNVTREGITADLEAMARVGVGGAQIFDVAPGIPAGPVDYGSTEWLALVRHAAAESARLGIELCMHNCAGWSSSGGPWVKPEHAMQMLVSSETRARGPSRFDAKLPQPETRMGFYRDIAVLAFPTPAAEAKDVSDLRPVATASAPEVDASKLVDGDWGSVTYIHLGRSDQQTPYVQLEFSRPFTARGLTLVPFGTAQGELQASDDGVTFRTVCGFSATRMGLITAHMTVSFQPVTARIFRLAFTRQGARGGTAGLAEVMLETGARINNWAAKAGCYRVDNPAPDTPEVPPEACVELGEVADLTDRLSPEGRLVWDVPAGDWTIMRFGYTVTGKDNHPAPEPGRGLECDKLSSEALDAFFDGVLAKVVEELGPLTGTGLKHLLIDSYEVDCQNWTPRFREEFLARRGYDPTPYLPAMVGRVVGSADASERFLWDVRRTIADLFADNYYGRFAELCHKHGLLLSGEPYGNGNFDDLQLGSRTDIPMTEFWVGWGTDNQWSKLAASMAHTHGLRYVGAESFTASDVHGRWQNHPYSLKALGDLVYCGGVNRFIFHRYAHQPWLDRAPGMTMGPWGFHFERTVTWWEQGRAWLEYITRCQYMLQEGLFVADLCYVTSEGAPATLPGRGGLTPAPPPGYDYDGCDREVVLNRMSVRDGRIVLPDGMSYRVLVLPPDRRMTPVLLRKVRELVAQGATVVGPKPTASPSLAGYPDADREVQRMAGELWGPCDGVTVTSHRFRKGTVVWGKPIGEVLASLGAEPDFLLTKPGSAATHYIHRTADGADVYFVSSQSQRPELVECSFRVSDRVPELWHPDTGETEIAPVYRREGGRTVVQLRFDPAGSVFVVFRRPAGRADPIVALERDGEPAFVSRSLSSAKLEIVSAVYGVLSEELPDMVDVTAQLRELVRDGTLSVVGNNSIAGDPAPHVVKQLYVEYTLDGELHTKTKVENELLTIPEPGEAAGRELVIRRALYGIIPDRVPEVGARRTVDVTEVLRGMISDNTLAVVASNALAGDPAELTLKQMRVDYTLDGRPYVCIVNENQGLYLPEGTEAEATSKMPPVARLSVDEAGRAALTAWQQGAYQATTASGRRLAATIGPLPAPIVVAGPWTLAFPEGLGAPPKAVLTELQSWTQSDDPGIRYFSGSATYTTTFTLPAGVSAAGAAVLLDLGAVREIAEVRLNGQDLGVLWKPPFRVDVTGIAQTGRNRLEVTVTNLWPNRLIGDEQLPSDCEWNPDGSLKAWPDWLLSGSPRPSDRVAFTTWRHYRQDSPVRESGMLGPVQVWIGQRVQLSR